MRRALFIRTAVLAVVLGGWLAGSTGTASAQGLIRTLPQDGTWVHYEGTYRQVEFRPDPMTDDLTIDWIRHLTLKSVGRETAEFEGEMQPCRWIEIKLVTGKPTEEGLDPGPLGARLFKVLVPEARIIDQPVDTDGIPVSLIPIVEGYRQFGDGPVEPIESAVLQIYPTISLLMHYKDLDEADEEDPEVPLGPLTAQRYTGEVRMESPTSRSDNQATLWYSDEVPFGLAKWRVTMVRETKDSPQPRNAFEPVTEVTEEMSAHAMGEDAESELVVP